MYAILNILEQIFISKEKIYRKFVLIKYVVPIIKFPQRAGALREFVTTILGPDDDITHFEYTKKVNRENDVTVVGLELKYPDDLEPLITKMKQQNFFGDYLNDKPDLFQFLI